MKQKSSFLPREAGHKSNYKPMAMCQGSGQREFCGRPKVVLQQAVTEDRQSLCKELRAVMTCRVIHAFLNSQVTQKDSHAFARSCSEEECVPSHWMVDDSGSVYMLPVPRVLPEALTDWPDGLFDLLGPSAGQTPRHLWLPHSASLPTAAPRGIHTAASGPWAERPDKVCRGHRSSLELVG